ncbi:MAG TPA: hypothetical protein VG269_16720 [Tepidisphaeraceae bacterium]|nr:hypothetical protein [Tepidisphaeraceae bacterium]
MPNMKKLWDILVLMLAINFLAVGGGIAWLYQSGRLDRKRVAAIKEVLFPPPEVPAPATQPAAALGPVAPSQRLEELLAKHTGRSATEQVEFIRQTFDATAAQLDQRQRVVGELEQQVALANRKVVEDRKALEAERARLTEQEAQAERLAGDKGFQDTLNLYNTMPGKQVKAVFMGMDEQSAAEYLDAMPPRSAARIIKEFKAPEETERMKRILDKMRHVPGLASAAVGPATREAKE